ncbi:MAG: polysaccharide lyase family protein [Acidobacteriaceae bacterium]
MTKVRILFGSMFLALAVFLIYAAVAQPAAPAKPAAAASAKPAAAALPKVAKVTVNDPVTLTDNGDTWTMDNGLVKLSIRKSNGSIATLIYHGVSVLGRGGENWERTPGGTITARVTIDPATNGGQRAEVSVKGVGPGAPAGAFGGGARGAGAPGAPGAGARGPRGGGAPGAAGAGAPGAAVAGAPGAGAPGARGGGAPGAPGARGGFAGGPGGRPGNGMDIETRYTLERGSSGFYTYAEYTHPASYPEAHVGEDRFILESMNPTFDWLSVDNDRNMLMSFARGGITIHAKEQSIYTSGIYKNSVEHKYTYNQDMYKLTAWGWSSTKDHIGVYFVNPSNEYISGGPEKLDLIDHLQSTILDYWTSGHYGGGANTDIAPGQDWKRVVGPIYVYFNALDNPKDPSQADLDKLTATSGSGMPAVPKVWHDNALALWNDAVAKSKTVKAAWPYNWVHGVDYPQKAERGTVTGQFVLDDPQATKKTLPNLNVGLTHANFAGTGEGFQTRAGNGNVVTWPHDGVYYEFWTIGSADGRFTIPNVRPGTYVLRAFANGVLGEYDRTAKVTVEAGKKIDLGKIEWQPVRYGKQVWEIGYPDRTGDKFFKGDGANYWLWGWGLRYSLLFPNDITYTIGKSNYAKDWFFQEVPHSTTTAWLNPAAKDPANQRFGWVAIPATTGDPWGAWGRGRSTTWTVKFNMAKASTGTAVLRIALAGADSTTLTVGVNGQEAGSIRPVATNALRYNTDKGVWNQYIVKFDASLMKAGANEMTFTVPAGDETSGVVWDYVRLELNDGSKTYPTPPDNQRPDFPTLDN